MLAMPVSRAGCLNRRLELEVWNENKPHADVLIGATRLKIDKAVGDAEGNGLGEPLRATLALSRPGKGEAGKLSVLLVSPACSSRRRCTPSSRSRCGATAPC